MSRRSVFVSVVVLLAVGITGVVLIYTNQSRHFQRLREMEERAQAAGRLLCVGRLGAGLAHEIRNPLNAMRMQIAVMRGKLKRLQREEAEAAAEQLSRLESEVLRLQELATSFLAYGRPPTDKLQEFKAAGVLRDVADFLKTEFEQRVMDIKLEIDPQLDGATIEMDRSKLRQVLLNLAENARHAMSEGGTLTLGLAKETNGRLRFTVQDTGCGIPPESLTKIFDAFFSMKDDGNGLGLSIVKQIVESSGGAIHVRSEVGHGTCFTLCFPTTRRARLSKLAVPAPAQPSEART
jgi:signal transduction histidine kinase